MSTGWMIMTIYKNAEMRKIGTIQKIFSKKGLFIDFDTDNFWVFKSRKKDLAEYKKAEQIKDVIPG